MFGYADLFTVCIIEEKLEFLAHNPHHIEFILCPISTYPRLCEKIGTDHINSVIKHIVENKIEVQPYHRLDNQSLPVVSVVASGDESRQFIGDAGATLINPNGSVKTKQTFFEPRVFAKFDATSIDNNSMIVAKAHKISETLFPRAFITNGEHSAVVDGIIAGDAEDTICLKEDLPEGTDLTGWEATTSSRNLGYNINYSMDSVQIQCQLLTNGDPDLHRAFDTILRYCIKSQRMKFETFGIHNTKISYTPVMVAEDVENHFQSVVTINAEVTDGWIVREFLTPDRHSKIGVSGNAVSSGNEPVGLDEL